MRINGYCDGWLRSGYNINKYSSTRLNTPSSNKDSLTLSHLYEKSAKSTDDVTYSQTDCRFDASDPEFLAMYSKNAIIFSKEDYSIDHEEMQKEIERLTDLLKLDDKFVNNSYRDYLQHPIGKELASALILDSEEYQDKIAKCMWEDWSSANAIKSTNPEKYGPPVYLPPSYKDYNIKAMLLSDNEGYNSQVLLNFYGILNAKAVDSGLTETERLISATAEKAEFRAGIDATFDNRMSPIMAQIEQAFENANMTFDKSKKYSFSLDTSDFTFSVSGGADVENALIEQTINKTDGCYNKYYSSSSNKAEILSALHNHRQDDGKYTPWDAARLKMNDNVLKYGIANVDKDYTEKMKLLFPAYNICNSDTSMKKKLGFGLDDIIYTGNNIFKGKTDEITKIINGMNFYKDFGANYLENLKTYKGTPEFTDPMFTFENGSFNVLY